MGSEFTNQESGPYEGQYGSVLPILLPFHVLPLFAQWCNRKIPGTCIVDFPPGELSTAFCESSSRGQRRSDKRLSVVIQGPETWRQMPKQYLLTASSYHVFSPSKQFINWRDKPFPSLCCPMIVVSISGWWSQLRRCWTYDLRACDPLPCGNNALLELFMISVRFPNDSDTLA